MDCFITGQWVLSSQATGGRGERGAWGVALPLSSLFLLLFAQNRRWIWGTLFFHMPRNVETSVEMLKTQQLRRNFQKKLSEEWNVVSSLLSAHPADTRMKRFCCVFNKYILSSTSFLISLSFPLSPRLPCFSTRSLPVFLTLNLARGLRSAVSSPLFTSRKIDITLLSDGLQLCTE